MRKPVLLGFTRLELIVIAIPCAAGILFGIQAGKKVIEYLTVTIGFSALFMKLYTWIYNDDSSDGKQDNFSFYSLPGVAWLGYEKDNRSTAASGEESATGSLDASDAGGDSGGDSGGGSSGGE